MAQLDSRSVANEIIHLASEYQKNITHLSLQKILYFVHGRYLIETEQPLIKGYFEAWPYGPVHPLIYETFKESGAENLTQQAKDKDLLTGEITIIPRPDNMDTRLYIRKEAAQYLSLSAGRLVDLAHAKNSPWDILTRGEEKRKFGLRITNDIILSSFRFHKISIDKQPRIGEPSVESPPPRD